MLLVEIQQGIMSLVFSHISFIPFNPLFRFLFIIIIMFMKGYVHSLFLNPQSGVGPSTSSSVVLCSFVLLVCIVMLVLYSICVHPLYML